MDAHHAIIPTSRSRPSGRLSEAESRIYNLISRFYLMQFMTDAVHREGRLDIALADQRFRASETAVAEAGWKVLQLRARDPAPDDQEQASRKPLPRLAKGDTVLCTDSNVKERITQPPQPFTDATLLSAMTNIARFVSDPELRKTLRETDGLGTEATRAAILETLFRRDYLKREGRHIRSTDKGRSLIHGLPESISQPDMTALWEATLEQIRQGSGDPREFIQQLRQQILSFIEAPAKTGGAGISGPGTVSPGTPDQLHCPKCRAPMTLRDGKFGRFFACTRFPSCKGTRPIEDHTPEDGSSQKPHPCPACFSPLVRRNGKKGWFWGCSNFPACRQTVDDSDGLPAATAAGLRKTT